MEFVSQEMRKNSSRDMLERLRNMLSGFTGAELTIDKVEEGPPTGPPVNIEIVGEDFEALGDIAGQVKQRIESILMAFSCSRVCCALLYFIFCY